MFSHIQVSNVYEQLEDISQFFGNEVTQFGEGGHRQHFDPSISSHVHRTDICLDEFYRPTISFWTISVIRADLNQRTANRVSVSRPCLGLKAR